MTTSQKNENISPQFDAETITAPEFFVSTDVPVISVEHDGEWLQMVAPAYTEESAADFVAALNNSVLLTIDSPEANAKKADAKRKLAENTFSIKTTLSSLQAKVSVRKAAKAQFMTLLGVYDENSPFYGAGSNDTTRTSTIGTLETIRLFYSRAQESLPNVIELFYGKQEGSGLSSISIKRKVELLEANGIDSKRLLVTFPRFLKKSDANPEQFIASARELGNARPHVMKKRLSKLVVPIVESNYEIDRVNEPLSKADAVRYEALAVLTNLSIDSLPKSIPQIRSLSDESFQKVSDALEELVDNSSRDIGISDITRLVTRAK